MSEGATMADIEIIEGDGEGEELLNRFRERVFAAIDDSIDHSTVPLIIEDGTRTIETRSGILLQIADMHFLVTAGHNMVEHSEKGHRVGIVLPVKGSHPILLVEERFWTTKDDQEDISVTQLGPVVVDNIKDHYRYIRLTSVMSRYDRGHRRAMYVIYGFPEALVGPDDTGVRRMESWRYLTIPFQGDFGTVEKYDPKLHLVVTYERRSYGREGARVHPPGMSGCGIWFVGMPQTHPLFTADDFKLVAIQNCWHKGFEYAKGTWIDDVLLILWKYYPDTHKPLMLAGYNFSGR
jgi:hypothetical protein